MEGKKSLRGLTVTDTHSCKLKRLGVDAILRVLNAPTNLTSDSKDNYAMVWCEDYGIYIVRFGSKAETATYVLACALGYREEHKGPNGCDYVVRKFLRMLRKGKAYYPRYSSHYGERLPHEALKFNRRK